MQSSQKSGKQASRAASQGVIDDVTGRIRDTLAAGDADHWLIINSDDGMGKKDGGKAQLLRQAVEEWRDRAIRRNRNGLRFVSVERRRSMTTL